MMVIPFFCSMPSSSILFLSLLLLVRPTHSHPPLLAINPDVIPRCRERLDPRRHAIPVAQGGKEQRKILFHLSIIEKSL